MDDFNDAMQSIDAAVAANSAAIENGVKIATGSYVGTGVCGESNPNSLTFDFVPKLVIVGLHPNGLFLRNQNNQCGFGYSFIWTYGQTSISVMLNSVETLTASLQGNTLSWYGDNAVIQLNFKASPSADGDLYDYIAIG